MRGIIIIVIPLTLQCSLCPGSSSSTPPSLDHPPGDEYSLPEEADFGAEETGQQFEASQLTVGLDLG